MFIETETGESYESDEETLQPAPEVDTMYIDRYQEVTVSENGGDIVRQFWQIILETETTNDAATYLQWKYDGLTQIFFGANYPCWFDHEGPENFLNVLAVEDQVAGTTIKHQLIVLGKDATYENYNLYLKQYALNKNSYQYWETIQQDREQTGTLFDAPPAQNKSNLFNPNNSKDVVLGYFVVAGETRYTYAFNKFRIPILLNNPFSQFWPECTERPRPQTCFDCTNFGGDPNRPEHWIAP